MKLTKENILKGNVFDIFTFVHILSGIWISGFLELYITKDYIFEYGFLIHLLYEIKDFLGYYEIIKIPNSFKYIWGDSLQDNDFINSIGDQIAFIIGYYIYKSLETFNYYITPIRLFIIFIFSVILLQVMNNYIYKYKIKN